MALFIISIPFMIVAIGIAVVPLIGVSRSEVRHLTAELERHREQRLLAHEAHQGHSHAAHEAHRPALDPLPTPAITAKRAQWHEPVHIEHQVPLTRGG